MAQPKVEPRSRIVRPPKTDSSLLGEPKLADEDLCQGWLGNACGASVPCIVGQGVCTSVVEFMKKS